MFNLHFSSDMLPSWGCLPKPKPCPPFPPNASPAFRTAVLNDFQTVPLPISGMIPVVRFDAATPGFGIDFIRGNGSTLPGLRPERSGVYDVSFSLVAFSTADDPTTAPAAIFVRPFAVSSSGSTGPRPLRDAISVPRRIVDGVAFYDLDLTTLNDVQLQSNETVVLAIVGPTTGAGSTLIITSATLTLVSSRRLY